MTVVSVHAAECQNIVNLTPLEGTTVDVRTDNPGRWISLAIFWSTSKGHDGVYDVTQ